MTHIDNQNQTFDSPSDALAHFGVKGMQWGVRKNELEGVSRRTSKEAYKDAQEFARAKMFYGKGAGTRRKLITATVEAKSKKDPSYKKAFDHHLAREDLGKHASKARSERKRKDVRESTSRTVRGAHRSLTGGFGNVTVAAALLAGGVVAAQKAGIDQVMKDVATQKINDHKSRRGNRQAVDDLLRGMGMK